MTLARANTMLLLAAFIWGTGNVVQKLALDQIGPFTLLAWRGVLGLLAICPWLIREWRRAGRVPLRTWPALLAAAVAFSVALTLQQSAARHSSVANLSFLLNTTIIFTPLLIWLCQGSRPALPACIAAATASAGVWLMSGGLERLGCGDMLCLLSALGYSAWIMCVGHLARTIDRPFLLAACQFLLVAAVGAAGSTGEPLVGAARLMRAAPEIVFLGVFSTGLAFTLQAIGQRSTSATQAALLMSLESVFGAAAATALLGEHVTAACALGAGFIVGAVVISELGGKLVMVWAGHLLEAARNLRPFARVVALSLLSLVTIVRLV